MNMVLDSVHKALSWKDPRHDNIKVSVNMPRQIIVYVDAVVLVHHKWDIDVPGMAQQNGRKTPVSVDLPFEVRPDIIRFRINSASRRHLTRVDTKSREEKDLRLLGVGTWPIDCGPIHAQHPIEIAWGPDGDGREDSLFIRLPQSFMRTRENALVTDDAAVLPRNGDLLLPSAPTNVSFDDPVESLSRELDALTAPSQQSFDDPAIATIAALTAGLHSLPQKIKDGFAKAFRDGRTRPAVIATAERYLFREYGHRRKIVLEPKIVRGVVSCFLGGLEGDR